MQYELPGSIVLSYLGGSLGNALAHLITASCTGEVVAPYNETYHVKEWPYEYIDCTITDNSVMRWNKTIHAGDVIQVHCANADIVCKKFPASKCIMLRAEEEHVFHAIQRQWMLNTSFVNAGVDVPEINAVKAVLSAWDWIEYNLDYLDSTGIQWDHPNALTLDFNAVLDNIELIEEFLQIKLSPPALKFYKQHIGTQLGYFHRFNIPKFKFAWDIYTGVGKTAPIQDLAEKFFS